MEIEDVAEKATIWSDAIKKIVAAITAAAVALIAAVSGVSMLWSDDEEPAPVVRTDLVPGYGPQCSQLYNTIEHTWTEAQWSVWESLRKDMNC
jgi:hypothetical protein|tara:strand:+ start:1010 stop:1288 length:279 start_codon:yes stop_codon:yes gene_type:complete